jgi:general secretion pathway protein L
MKTTLDTALAQAARLFRWWILELESIAQDLLALIAPTWSRPLTMQVAPHRLVISDGAAASLQLILELERSPQNSNLPETLPESNTLSLDRGRRVRVLLAPDYAFVNRLRLPLVAVPHLKSAVSLQIPKLMPLDAGQLMTDFEITSTNPDKSVIDIEIAAVRRSEVEPLLAQIRSWGFRVASVHLDTANLTSRFHFSSADSSTHLPTMTRTDRALIGTALCVGLACAAVAVIQSYRADHALARAQNLTLAPARAAFARRLDLTNRLEPLKALSKLESSITVGALLNQLSALIPHDTWLTTLEVKGRQVRMVGLSPDSAGLVKVLTGCPLFTDVELRSSMSAGIGIAKDRFEISATAQETKP